MIARALTYLLLFISHAHAGVMSIPLKDINHKLAPASDLVYQGSRINEVEAMELEENGIDLSLLDPYQSELFKTDSVTTKREHHKLSEVFFHSILQAPTEYFRFSSKSEDQNYTITASLFNHETIIRSNLLKKIGYSTPEIFIQQELKVNFKSISEMDLFLQKLVESTLLGKKKWVIEDNRSKLYLKLRGMIIESANSQSVPVYWPIMEETRQRKRRIFRSLFYLYTLTDFNMPINEIPWHLGKIFNNEIILAHPYTEEFSSVTVADLRWMHRKIISLSEEELCEGTAEAYPEDIGGLLCEKLKSRIMSLGKLLGIMKFFKINENFTNGQVKNGKLISGDYPDYVPTFWIEDAKNPFRFTEMFKFLRTQVTYDTIANILDSAQEKFLPGISTEDAFDDIVEKVREFGKKNGAIPLRVWSRPIASGSTGGSRSIVFGKYDGNDAPIQLVDTLNLKLQIGVFNLLSIPGTSIIPTAKIDAQLVRTWKHIKAMPDLNTASTQKIKNIIIPRLYHSLGNLLKNNTECSIQDDAWAAEEIVSGIAIWIIYYDKNNDIAKADALKLREELINRGTPQNKILLQSILKSDLCLKEINEKRNKTIEDFLKNFADNETLTVTDSLEGSLGFGIKANNVFTDHLKIQGGVEGKNIIIRSHIFRKTEDGIEITIQNQKNLAKDFFQDIKFFTKIMSNSTNWTNGELHSKVYRINLKNIDDEQKKIVVDILREIFLKGKYQLLIDHYNPINLDHEANLKLNTFSFFWKKSEKLSMNHEVTVLIPNKDTKREIPSEEIESEWSIPTRPPSDLSDKERTRNLFSTMHLYRKGSNYHSFWNQIINTQLKWLGTAPQEKDPGQSIKGKSFHNYVVTEGDLTEGRNFNPVTKIEFGNTGWGLTPENIEYMMQTHEKYLSTREEDFKLDRSIFNQTKLFRSYNFRTTLILYPSALQKILDSLISSELKKALSLLKHLYGQNKWEAYCRRPEPFQNKISWYEPKLKKTVNHCVPISLRNILIHREGEVPTRNQELGIKINSIVQTLIARTQLKNLLTWIGKENYFGNTFITGFRNGDAIGYLQYSSDTIGTYNTELETGIYDQIAGILGVSSYGLKGLVYTPNM